MLSAARKRARIAIGLLLGMYLAGIALFSEDVLIGLAVLVAGAATLLESAHGALFFDRVIRRFLHAS